VRQGYHDSRKHIFDCTEPVDRHDRDTMGWVVVDEWLGLAAVHLKTATDRILVVVVTPVFDRSLEKPVDKFVLCNGEKQHDLNRIPSNRAIEGICLFHVARKSVEQISTRSVAAGQPLGHHGNNQFIWNEISGRHQGTSLPPEFGTFGNRLAKHDTRGNMRHSESAREKRGLGTLTRSGRAEKQDSPTH